MCKYAPAACNAVKQCIPLIETEILKDVQNTHNNVFQSIAVVTEVDIHCIRTRDIAACSLFHKMLLTSTSIYKFKYISINN